MRTLQSYLLAGAFFLPVVVGAEARTPVKAQALSPVAAPARTHAREKHPAIHAAIRSLEKAQAELKAAAHDYGGHKAEAMRSVEEALKHLRLADAYDGK